MKARARVSPVDGDYKFHLNFALYKSFMSDFEKVTAFYTYLASLSADHDLHSGLSSRQMSVTVYL